MLAELVYQPDKNFEDGQSCPSLVETAILHKFCGSCWTGGRRPVVRAEKQEELRGVAERSWNMVASKVTGSDEVVEWIPVSYAAQTIYTLEDRYARDGSYSISCSIGVSCSIDGRDCPALQRAQMRHGSATAALELMKSIISPLVPSGAAFATGMPGK